MPPLSPRLRSIAVFGVSILLGKGLSLISIPLVAGHLSPEDFGRLEFIASIVEVAGLAMSFGLADTLFRFASGESESARVRIMSGFTGCALAIALIVGALLQCAAWLATAARGLESLHIALACGLLGATLSGLVELPLAWLRLQDRPVTFLVFTSARSLTQVALMFLTLHLGYGLTGILAGNAAVDLVLAGALLARQIMMSGVSIDRASISRTLGYGMPLVGGALSMFVLGACDRWFLAAAVTPAELGFYGLAAKLAMIVALVVSPFGMWWYPRRLEVLRGPDGYEASARMVSIGVILLGAGATIVCAGAPLFVSLLLPPAYEGALQWLPWLVLIVCCNEMCSLFNVGVYAEHHGLRVLAVNAAGAVVALLGYLALVAPFGVAGAVAATIGGQATRFALFLRLGHKRAPIAYPWALCGLVALVDIAALAAARAWPGAPARSAVIIAALGIFAALAWRVLRPRCAPALAEAAA